MTAVRPPRRKGDPLLLLAAVLCGWILARGLLWESPFLPLPGAALPFERSARPADAGAGPRQQGPASALRWIGPRIPADDAEWRSLPPAPTTPASVGSPQRLPRVGDRFSPAHQLLLMTGLGTARAGPGERGRRPLPAPRPATQGAPLPDGPSRWSGSAWLLVRGGDPAPGGAAGTAGYGGSQAGAALRFDLAPGNAYRPIAFVRASGALAAHGGGDRELAAGLAVRPVPDVPVALLVEGRFQHTPDGDRVRPVLTLVTELSPQRLPLNAEAEIYAQAGYAGGKNGTPFFDAQATVERPVIAVGPDAALRLGGGAWAGGQRGAVRLDVGPRAALRLDLGKVSTRISADWRFRVAGNATPGSGPALTLSAGF